MADLPVVPAGSNPPEGERGLREALVFYADADNYVGGEVGWWGSDRLGEPVWCMDFGSIARNALAAARVSTEGPAGSEQVCRACGGSGHRNGSLRAADPFGTCPGCDGTGVQDRDAAHQFPTQHGFAVTVARALESAAEAVRRERLRIVDLIGSEFPDSMPLLAGDVIGMLQADFLDRAERSTTMSGHLDGRAGVLELEPAAVGSEADKLARAALSAAAGARYGTETETQ